MKQSLNQSPYYPSQRIGVFIDVVNLYHSAKNIYHGRVNYAELMKHLVSGRQLVRAMAYVVKSEGIELQHAESAKVTPARPVGMRPNGARPVVGTGTANLSSEGAFFEALEKAGLELRVKDLQIYADGTKKGDWDVGMAVDAIRQAPFLDVIVLVTGDGDFLPLVDYLKWGMGRMVEVAAFRRSASAKIQEAADRFINIEEIPRSLIKR